MSMPNCPMCEYMYPERCKYHRLYTPWDFDVPMALEAARHEMVLNGYNIIYGYNSHGQFFGTDADIELPTGTLVDISPLIKAIKALPTGTSGALHTYRITMRTGETVTAYGRGLRDALRRADIDYFDTLSIADTTKELP